jgi:hypothetical protein
LPVSSFGAFITTSASRIYFNTMVLGVAFPKLKALEMNLISKA